MSIELSLTVLLILGSIPWRVSRRTRTRNGKQCNSSTQVHATFWQLDILAGPGKRLRWNLCIPLVQQLGSVAWTVTRALRANAKLALTAVIKAFLEKPN